MLRKRVITFLSLFFLFAFNSCTHLKENDNTIVLNEKTKQKRKDEKKKEEKQIVKENKIKKLYKNIKLEKKLDYKIFELAIKGFNKINPANKDYITIVDLTKPSNEKRLFVINLKKNEIIFEDLVAHGMKSGDKYATSFSNKDESHKSSLGFYLTGTSYSGSNGYSLKLYGLEEGLNDNAYSRSIVIHGADYVSFEEAKNSGRIGRSWGCLAVRKEINQEIIDTIKKDTVIFQYAKEYDDKSVILAS